MTAGFRTTVLLTLRSAARRCIISRGGLAFGTHAPVDSAFGEILRAQDDVDVVAIASKVVKLGFTFPSEPSVVREELVESIKLANWASARRAGTYSGFRQDRPAGQAALGTTRRET